MLELRARKEVEPSAKAAVCVTMRFILAFALFAAASQVTEIEHFQ